MTEPAKIHVTQAELFEIAECRDKPELIEWLNDTDIKHEFLPSGEVYSTSKWINDCFIAPEDREPDGPRLSSIEKAVQAFPSYLFTPDEILGKAMPYPLDGKASSGVYFLIMDNRIVYAGRSQDINWRLSQHRVNKVFTHVSYIQIARKTDIRCVEAYYINKFKPELNIDYPLLDSEFKCFL